ncbi:hypothetical protein [Mycobacteroides chelonae]|nr:hypothetical protein [Mycobacteroides chelonae]
MTVHRMALVDVFDATGAFVGQRSECSCGDHTSRVGNDVSRATDNAAHIQLAAMRGETVL